MTTVTVEVDGAPVPQGSLKHIGNGRMISDNPKLAAWRNDVRRATIMAIRSAHWPTNKPVEVELTFRMPRPKSHYGTGRNAGTIKARHVNAAPAVYPDVDKLCRAFGDSITVTRRKVGGQSVRLDDGLIFDDGQIVKLVAEKVYSEQPGMSARVTVIADKSA